MSITHVQSNGNVSSAGATTISATLPSGVVQGNLLVFSITRQGATGVLTPPDASWVQDADDVTTYASPINTELWHLVVDAAHAGATSWTWTVATGSGRLNTTVAEYSSTTGWPANPLDQTAVGNTGAATATTIVSGTTPATTQAEEVWVAALAYKAGPQTETGITAGFTKDQESSVSGGNVSTSLYNIVSSTGAAACQYTIGTAEQWSGCIATFKTVVITPTLSTSPTSLTFSAAQGGANPASQNDTLSETAGAATAWTSSINYTSGSGWLSISPSSGSLGASGNTTLSVSPTTGALTGGTYTATITFTATTGGSQATISVTFTVTAPAPVLATSPASMTFSAQVGGSDPAAQNDTLSETNGQATAWTSSISYGSGSGWLSISPTSGSLGALGSAPVSVSPSLGVLTVGTYTATVTFTATTGGATATIAVTFNVTAATPGLATSPTSLSFSGTAGGTNPASQNSTLSETNGTGTAWTSSISYGSGTGWLSISPTSGTLAANGTTPVGFSCTLASLSAGTYTATVTFTATTGGATATVAVTFTVAVPPAPIANTSPTVLAFSGTVGQASPPAQNVTLSNLGNLDSAWSVSVVYHLGSGWLVTAPTSGTLVAGTHTTISVTCVTGALAAATYTATATYSMGTSEATVDVTFNVHPFVPPPPTASKITLAGQDITNFVDQMSVKVDDTLGQGQGAGNSGATQGRAATVSFNTNLGPMNTALGAGETIPSTGGPYLVRQGEIVVTDATGTIVFGGFATKYTDSTTSVIGKTKQNFTTVEGIDYSTSLQRTIVNEVFSAQTDIQIISFIMKKYAAWVNLDYLPASPAYLFPTKVLHNITVEQVLQTIAGITGYLVFVDYEKHLHYVSPTTASSAPFNLSDSPDFVRTFSHSVTQFVVDDNSAINRVFFYGGTKLSNDFWQDVSPMANGNNTVFSLAYFPSPQSDGKYHVKLNGTELVVGSANGTTPANTLKSKGGLADVLIDAGSKSLTFDVAPATGSSVLVGYRYSFPLSLILTDEKSHSFFGDPYLDGSIDDSTIFDLTTAIQRCRVLLSQQSYGLVTLTLDTYKGGAQAGMVINVKNAIRGINATYLIQEIAIEPLGGGNYVYHMTLGAWNWNLIDFLLKLPTLATFQDDQQDETQEIVTIEQVLSSAQVTDAWSHKESTPGQYYARATAVGDGHDAFPGFASVTA